MKETQAMKNDNCIRSNNESSHAVWNCYIPVVFCMMYGDFMVHLFVDMLYLYHMEVL